MSTTDIPFGRPWITDDERDAVMQVLNGHILTHGPNCTAFEDGFRAMMGDGHATSTSSCMASLHLCSIDLGVGPGDEVIVPAMTHVATVHAVELTGATPVFVDCELTSGNMDLDALGAAITPRTKAISVVHYAAIPCDMVRVMDIAGDIPVIEDCALALGARVDGRHVGLWGHAGCYSFYPVKHITTGEGGMLVSKNADTVARIARFRAFNVDRTHTERKIPGIYDVTGVGMNYRMSEMQAAIGCQQLKKVPDILAQRRTNFTALKAGLDAIENVRVLDSAEERLQSTHYCAVTLLEGPLAARRDDIIVALNARGIGTSVYYPHPIPRLTYYRDKYGYNPADFPGAIAISDHAIALPCGPHLDVGGMTAITAAMREIVLGLTRS